MTNSLRSTIFVASTGYLVSTMMGCANRADDCESSATCTAGGAGGESPGKPTGSGGTTGGADGSENPRGGTASNVESMGTNVGTGASSGNLGMGSNAAFGTTRPPCDARCTEPEAVCDSESDRCVACLDDTDCHVAGRSVCSTDRRCVECNTTAQCVAEPSRPVCAENRCVQCATSAHCVGDPLRSVCDPSSRQCVGCVNHEDCLDEGARSCDPRTKLCVACLSSDDCTKATASRCNPESHTCTSCAADEDCSHVPGKGVCDSGTCVECTGKKNQACGTSDGVALVCDSLAKTCSKVHRVQSSGLCQPCISDLQCRKGQLCLAQSYKGEFLGYFCFWKQGDTENGAPVDCALKSNRPYVNLQSNVSSIDGEQANLCTLRSVTTCKAIHQYSAVDCAPNGVAEPELCGVVPGEDARCVPFGATQYRCTSACLSADDCVGSDTGSSISCDTGTTPRVCTLN
ncbi:MAG: hypothetical protein QM784_05220 [Polyangiaceae bacterium]